MREEALARHERLFRTLGNWRLAVVVAGAIVAYLNYWLLPVPVAALIGLMIYHERIDLRCRNEKRCAEFYRRAIARIETRWQTFGQTGERFCDPHHPYADDLDVFGKGSLFQLI